MDIPTRTKEALPDTQQAIKILKKLVSEYKSFYDEDPLQPQYMEDLAVELSESDLGFPEIAGTLGRMLQPAIEYEIEATYDEIAECEELQNETLSAIAQIWDTAAANFEIEMLDDGTMNIVKFEQEQKQAEALNLSGAKFDLRSLERAVTTLKGQSREPEFSRMDAHRTIMEIAYG